MWRERLVRFLLVGLVTALALGAVKAFAGWQKKNPLVGKQLSLPELSVEKLQSQSEDALGNILGKKSQPAQEEQESQFNQENEFEDKVNQENQEAGSIAEPVENIQEQTQELIESIKKLPEDQIKAIKKQIYKEFCEELLEEDY